MPTNATILLNAPIACVLAGNDVAKGNLFGKRIDPLIAQKIYCEYFKIKKIYDLDPDYAGMSVACQYLWELMGKYGIRAQSYTGGGGSVSPSTGTQGFPIYITQADFTTATFYPNTHLFGIDIIVFLNEINRYLIPNTEFTWDATGVTITMDGFDASTYDYNLVIEKVYT